MVSVNYIKALYKNQANDTHRLHASLFCCFFFKVCIVHYLDASTKTNKWKMPKIRRSKKKPPEGWELIEPTLEELEQKMREGKCSIANTSYHIKGAPEIYLAPLTLNQAPATWFSSEILFYFLPLTAETDSHEGKRISESLWPIFKVHHQKSRYIYDLYYRRKAISRELYDYCINEKIADANLIAKWKKSGYENLCCLRCIQTRDTNFGTNCICRVPKAKLEEGRVVECVHCGCRGCSG